MLFSEQVMSDLATFTTMQEKNFIASMLSLSNTLVWSNY